MSLEGHAMDGFFAGFYHFSPCETGEWQYQEDIGQGFIFTNPSYVEFMKEMNVQIVQHWGPWVILRRKTQEGEFKLYSDVDGQIAQYKKILLMFKIVVVIEIICLMFEVYSGIKGIALGWAFALLISAFIIAFCNIIIRTKNIINELKERKGEAPVDKKRTLSPLVSAGLLLDSCTLIIKESLPRPIIPVLLFLAIAMIIFGTIQTVVSKR
jgi:hypothetical protein